MAVTEEFARKNKVTKISELAPLAQNLIFGAEHEFIDRQDGYAPYYAAPIIRNETLEKHPELETILNELAGMISDEEMQQMNYQAESENKTFKEIARNFLEEKGLLAE